MSDYDNEQDFTGAVIAKIKQLFESRTARIVMAAVLAAIVIIILVVVMLSGGSGEEFESSDLSQAVRDENSASSETAPESEEVTETTDALKYQMTKISSDSPVFSMINNNAVNPYKLSVEIAAEGYAESSLTATESGYSAFIENESIQGTIVELAYPDGLEVEKVKLMFEIKDSAIENTLNKYTDTSDEFKGIKRFDVFMYDEELNMQLPLETKYDLENNIVYAETDRCGTYALVDMEILVDMLSDS
ncbi:MAG: hypothetical protein K2N60_00330 [Oscillospiraceae bacterium]|nr:hypothetical protein [Oscillospiraceae bacterium]